MERNSICASQVAGKLDSHLNDLLGTSQLGSEFLVLQHLLVGSLEQTVAANC